MKKLTKFLLTLIGLGTVIGAAFVYLKEKGYITVTSGGEDEDYDDFSAPDEEYSDRTYINVNTEAMASKAKEVYQDVASEIKDKAEDAYDEAKKMAGNAKDAIANTLEKAWYEVGDQVEKVEEFFNDED